MNAKNSRHFFALCLPALAILAACAQRIPFERETSPLPLPQASYLQAARSGAIVYRILPEESLLLVRVGRSGAMANLGHDHVIASRDVQGFVQLAADPSASRADVAIPLKSLIVDRPEFRARFGLGTEPSDDEVAGTYSNMRKVLEAELFPWATAQARFTSVHSAPPEISVSITMHGTTHEYVVPIQLESVDKRLTVSGQMTVTHSDFALTLFRAAGGLLRVAEELQVKVELVGRRISANQ